MKTYSTLIVAVAGTAYRPMVSGIVVDMPTATVLLVKDAKGNVWTCHENEILRQEVI